MTTINIVATVDNFISVEPLFDDGAAKSGTPKTYTLAVGYERLVFKGTGFTFDSHGTLTGGQVTSAAYSNHGTLVAQFGGFTIDGHDLGAVEDYSGFYDLLGDINFIGNKGDDYEYAGRGQDTLSGGAGNDTLQGNNGDDVMHGDAGNDFMQPYLGTDTLDGGKGLDTLELLEERGANGVYNNAVDLAIKGSQTVYTYDPYYSLTVTLTSVENVRGSDGADHLLGNALGNRLEGGGGNDVLGGRGGADLLDGGAGADTADYSGYVAARVDLNHVGPQDTGKAGRDTLVGIENLTGGSGKNVFIGDAGGNALDGAGGDDILVGGGGSDTLAGGAGLDRLDGGAGVDLLVGGDGADVFTFGAVADANDLIVDFGTGDRMDLSRIDANTTEKHDQAFTFTGNSGFHHIAGELVYYLYTTPQGVPIGQAAVYGDVDGDGSADFTITLINRFSGFSSTDFVL